MSIYTGKYTNVIIQTMPYELSQTNKFLSLIESNELGFIPCSIRAKKKHVALNRSTVDALPRFPAIFDWKNRGMLPFQVLIDFFFFFSQNIFDWKNRGMLPFHVLIDFFFFSSQNIFDWKNRRMLKFQGLKKTGQLLLIQISNFFQG